MGITSKLAQYIRSSDQWLNVKPFDTALEKEYRQKQFEASIPPIIAMTFVGGLAFIVLVGIQHFEANPYKPDNIHFAVYRIVASATLLSAAATLVVLERDNPFVKWIVSALIIFLTLLYPTSHLFRSIDQNSTSELGLAGILYISAFCFRLERVKFMSFMLIIGIGHFVSFFFLRGVLAPVNNYGSAFDITERIPASLVPQVQVLQAFIFAYFIYWLMDSRERKLFLREKKLELSNQNRLQLLQAVGHDLRQPMTSILLQQGIAKEAAKLNNHAQLFGSLEIIETSMQAISAELSQLTEIAAIQSNEYVPRIKSEAIVDLMNDLSRAFTAETHSRLIEFSIHVDKAIRAESVHTDRQIIGRVLNNLVSNAIKYSKDPFEATPRIDVFVSLSTSHNVEIQIKDNGIGIAEANIEKIWQPFFQVQNAERDRLKGYGLGLTQVRVALEKLTGHRVECSSKLGQGSEFKVVIDRSGGGVN